uniref:Uncharacterized protein n=1 Tax=Romanomermis culicivorax TaxID=13658 RepID=A0A915K0J8_ROMCU
MKKKNKPLQLAKKKKKFEKIEDKSSRKSSKPSAFHHFLSDALRCLILLRPFFGSLLSSTRLYIGSGNGFCCSTTSFRCPPCASSIFVVKGVGKETLSTLTASLSVGTIAPPKCLARSMELGYGTPIAGCGGTGGLKKGPWSIDVNNELAPLHGPRGRGNMNHDDNMTNNEMK